MHPILARLGPFFIYSYTVIVGLGIILGFGLAASVERRGERRIPGWIDAFLVALVAGIICGRFVFIVINWNYYQENIEEIAIISRGGLSYHGVLIAGLLAVWFWTLWRRRPFDSYAGLIAPALALGSVFGWLACWLEGCAFGLETTFGPFVADLPDSFGVFALRYQTQLIGIVICLLIFILVMVLRRYFQPLLVFWLTLLLLSAGRILISLFRGDEAPLLGQLRLDTVADGLFVAICLIAIIFIIARQRRLGVSA